MRPIPDKLVSEPQDPEETDDPTVAEIIKLERKKTMMTVDNPRL